MKKHDFKKLALLGMAAGSLVATQSASASADAGQISANYLAAHSCGSSGCNGVRGSSTGSRNNQVAEADEVQPTTRQAGCHPYQNNNMNNGTTNGTSTNGQRQAGCHPYQSNPNNNTMNGQRQAGCNAPTNYNNSNTGTTNGQRQAGCNAPRPNYNNSTYSNQGYLACGCEDEEEVDQAST